MPDSGTFINRFLCPVPSAELEPILIPPGPKIIVLFRLHLAQAQFCAQLARRADLMPVVVLVGIMAPPHKEFVVFLAIPVEGEHLLSEEFRTMLQRVQVRSGDQEPVEERKLCQSFS